MGELRTVCWAARALHPAADSPSVLCGVLDKANDGAHVNGFEDRGHVSPVISGDRDRSAVSAYCCGTGIPGSVASYTACPIWRAAKEAEWARRRGPDALRDEQATRPPAVRDQVMAGA
jgi:hypothetical protein